MENWAKEHKKNRKTIKKRRSWREKPQKIVTRRAFANEGRYRQEALKSKKQKRKQQRARERKNQKNLYEKYIKGKRWKKIRGRAGKPICFVCGAMRKDRTITIHHITYKNLGNEKSEDLVPLCWEHHKGVHNLIDNGVSPRKAHIVLKDQYYLAGNDPLSIEFREITKNF